LRYWLEKIFFYRYAEHIKPANEVFQPYIRFPAFGYVGVVELGERLNVPGWDKPPPNLKEIWAAGARRHAATPDMPSTSPGGVESPPPEGPYGAGN
jgi:hypothetical protein